jgi:hypothetical protein
MIISLFLGHLVSEIGIAGLVGFILALTFERLSAGEFQKLARQERDAIKTDVFHYVYGYGIPRPITDMIDKQILKSPFVRKNMRATFTLVLVDGPDKTRYVRVSRKLAYEIENLTDRPRRYPFIASTDLAPIPHFKDQSKLISLQVENCAKPIVLDETAIAAKQTETDVETVLQLNDGEIMVLPDKTTKVIVASQTVKHLEGGYLHLILSNHTCDLEVIVRVPNRDLNVFADPNADNTLQKSDTHDPDLGIYHWNIAYPVLAYQGIKIGWNQKT